jgi:uncharacterized protein YegL
MPDDELPHLAQQPLHFFLLLDCSGSMAADGKIQALNSAVLETIPHLEDVSESNPHAQVLARAIAFSSNAHWHVETPTPVAQLDWADVTAGGYTDLGSALDLLALELSSPPMATNALPPAIVLVSDGMPTDDYMPSLDALLATEWGAQSIRAAVAIGSDADIPSLRRFMGGAEPLSASNPQELTVAIRRAASRTTVLASTLSPWVPFAPQAASKDVTEAVWGSGA